MKKLLGCYAKQVYNSQEFWLTLAKALPKDLSESDGEQLSQRIATECKYAPSISEIVNIWRMIKRERFQRRQYAIVESASDAEDGPDPELLKKVKEHLRGFKSHEPMPTRDIPKEAHEFISGIFPDLSETIIADDLTDIEYCMRERQKEERNHSPYRTTLRMGRDGHLELWMQKVRT